VLRDLIGATDRENLIILRDLHVELQGILFRVGRFDEARKAARTAQDLSVRIVKVLRQTKVPGEGRTLATDKDISDTEDFGRTIDEQFARAKPLAGEPPLDARRYRILKVKQMLDDMKEKGKISESDHRANLEQLARSERGEAIDEK
jgi:hypothetical protein